MANNKHQHQAAAAQDDEFYTTLIDIENELGYYKKHFKNKVVLCNCDDPEESNFWKYFANNFDHLGLKKLIATHYDPKYPTYKLELVKDLDGDGRINEKDTIKTPLKQNGDFKNLECIKILKEADIVVTNPPFSLFIAYIGQLIEYKKKFLIIGDYNKAINCKDIFPYFLDKKIWFGYTQPKAYLRPDGTTVKMGNHAWFTNLTGNKKKNPIITYKTYKGNESNYPKYDNYDVIEVSETKDIPKDYDGIMGVPISAFYKILNSDQFEILGMCNDKYWRGNFECLARINGQSKYARLLIKYKRDSKDEN